METDRLLSDAFLTNHPTDAARVIESRPVAEAAALLRECDPDRIAPVMALMDPTVSAAVVREVDRGIAAGLVEAIPAHTASVVLRRLTPGVRDAILVQMSPAAAVRARTLLSYPTGSAGALVDPAVLTAPPDLPVREMLLRMQGAGTHVHDYLFVVDRRGLLLGVISVRELLAAASDLLVGAAAHREIATLRAAADRDEIMAHPSWNDLHTLPVVDDDGRFLGIVRYKTLRRLETEAPATPLGTAAADAALDIGELVWSGGAAVLGEIIALVSPPAPPITRGQAGE